MTCTACSQIIEQESNRLPGIIKSSVNFATETAEFETDSGFDSEILQALLKKLGYRALDPKNISDQKEVFFDKSFNKAFVSLILASVVMIFAMVIPYFNGTNWIQALFTTLILSIYGRPYVKAVFEFFTSFKSNMNTLIGLGALSAYFYSWYILFLEPHAHTYFEGTAFIIAFSLLGHFLDNKAKTKARNSLSSLYKMQIKFASRIIEGKEANTPVVELKKDDIIRLRPGEKFPLDGEIIEGETHADEAMITGESQVVSKTLGSKVYAGSINMEGSVLIKISSEFHDTTISHIVSFVEEAQLKKAPIQLYADKIVKYFVPFIIALALMTFMTWFSITKDTAQALTHMITVLVIACPCALGLAVPMAIMISTSEAAKSGLLVNGGHIIEKGSHINAIIFDKTGTLTEGNPELTSIVLFDKSKSEDSVLKIAASTAQYSAHPLSQCLHIAAIKKSINLTDPDKFENLTGLGIIARVDGKEILLGNTDLLKEQKVTFEISPDFYTGHIGSYVFMAIDKKLIAAFIITAPVKKEAAGLIENLKKQNIEVWMLTGDHTRIAHKIGSEIGIEDKFIKAEIKPAGKAKFVEELQMKGLKVAMIGDGINDAPALSKADLSIAMGSGSDVAIEASEVSVLEGKILLVDDFFNTSKRTMKIIRENLLLSSLYNILCIPLAAGAFYPWYKVSLTPMWASLAMGLSSLSVILNSLRLKKSPHKCGLRKK
jgi:Cu+-exporting ATPase